MQAGLVVIALGFIILGFGIAFYISTNYNHSLQLDPKVKWDCHKLANQTANLNKYFKIHSSIITGSKPPTEIMKQIHDKQVQLKC